MRRLAEITQLCVKLLILVLKLKYASFRLLRAESRIAKLTLQQAQLRSEHLRHLAVSNGIGDDLDHVGNALHARDLVSWPNVEATHGGTPLSLPVCSPCFNSEGRDKS